MIESEITPHHILIFKCDDGKRFLSVAIDKHEGRWAVFGDTFQPLHKFNGWIRFLKRQRHTVYGESLEKMVAAGMPLVAVKPNGSKAEALYGVAWFMTTLHETQE